MAVAEVDRHACPTVRCVAEVEPVGGGAPAVEAMVVGGDVERALSILRPRDDEPVRLAFPPGVVEVSTYRGVWETVVFRAEGFAPGPDAVTVPAGELDACVRGVPMYVNLTSEAGALSVSGWPIAGVDPMPAPPLAVALANEVDVDVPLLGANPYEAVLVDVDRGGRKAWVPRDLVQRLVLRDIRVARLFSTEPGTWFLSGVQPDETHPVAVAGAIRLY